MNDFDERLQQRLSALDAAVPPAKVGVGWIGSTPSTRRRRGDRITSRLPIGLAAALAVVIVGAAVVGMGLQHSPSTGPATSSTGTTLSIASPGPSRPPVILGSDGLPAEIDGERVYHVTDQAEWQNLSGSFLLAANIPSGIMPSCIPHTSGPPESDLLGGFCGGWALGSTTGSDSSAASLVYAAPKSQILLFGWANHPAVLRVHIHDSEAAQCSAAKRAACEAAVVVEAVVWPAVPTEINSERVYRSSDLRAMFSAGTFQNLSGSFLLGGVVSVFSATSSVQWDPAPCPTGDPRHQLDPNCSSPTSVTIDDAPIAPKSSFDTVDGQVVVVRAHINDPLAAQCPADMRTTCQEAIVVESVVWSSNPYPSATPTAATAPPTPIINQPSTR